MRSSELLLILIISIFGGKCLSLGHLLLTKRNVATNMDALLSRALSERDGDQQQQNLPNHQLSSALRQQFADIAAFGYSLVSTYTVRSSFKQFTSTGSGGGGGSGNGIPSFLAQLRDVVPEEFKEYFGPSTGLGDRATEAELQDLKCVDKCFEAMERQMLDKMGGPAVGAFQQSGLLSGMMGGQKGDLPGGLATVAVGTLGRLNCSDETQSRACVANCTGDGATSSLMFSTFLLAQLDWFLHQHCPEPSASVDLFKLLGNCQLAQVPQMALSYTFSRGKDFANQFRQAASAQQRCSAVKKSLIDDFAASLAGICDQADQARLVERMLRTTAGFTLGKNTEGAMFRRCPDLYSTN